MEQSPSFEHGFAGSSIVIAGATGGIGSALGRELHQRGATLTLVARRAGELERLDVPGQRLALDLRSLSNCRQAVEAAFDTTGRLDAVINAAGVVAFGPVADLSIDAMEELFLTNTFVSIFLAQAAIERLGPGGVVVNMPGVIAETNLPGMAAYGASKAAVTAFDAALAREVRRAGIRILDARPPHTETGLADRPIEGTAPKMPEGLEPQRVAKVICDAIEQGVDDLPSSAF